MQTDRKDITESEPVISQAETEDQAETENPIIRRIRQDREENKCRIAEIRNEVLRIGDDIIHSKRFQKAKHVPHHVEFTVAQHSMEVAMYALLITRAIKRKGLAPKLSEEEVVRAALLHDIGMTEDAVHDSPSYRKAFSHPREGLRIARDEYHLNKIQLNAIQRHMFPIGIIPPQHVLGWIIKTADDLSSTNEGLTLFRRRVKKFRERRNTK